MKKIIIITLLFTSLFGWVAQITALKGNANIIRNNTIIKAKNNIKLNNKDIIKTLPNSKVQIIFKDNTIITLQNNSKLQIVNYIFNKNKSIAIFNLDYGIVKILAGKILQSNPKNFKITIKNKPIVINGKYFILQKRFNNIKTATLMGETLFKNLKTMKNYKIQTNKELIVINNQIKLTKINTQNNINPSFLNKSIYHITKQITNQINSMKTTKQQIKEIKEILQKEKLKQLQTTPQISNP